MPDDSGVPDEPADPRADAGVAVGLVSVVVGSFAVSFAAALGSITVFWVSTVSIVAGIVLLIWRWYRLSRESGDSVFRSAGRSTKEALKAIFDMPLV